jgi:hypothetical protein
MKHVARILTALALVAYAAPALPCGAEKANKTVTHTETGTQPAGAVAKADKGEKPKKAEQPQKVKSDSAQKPAATN